MTRTRTTLSTQTLAALAAQVVANAQGFTYITNWFGARQRGTSDKGYGNLKYAELEAVIDAIKLAINTGQPLDATIIMEDFYAMPESIIGRQLLRSDEKYLERSPEQLLRFAAEEIAGSLEVLNAVTQEAALTNNVRVEVRVTKGRVSAPLACSENGLVKGTQPPNLSDSHGPTDWYEPGSEMYDLYKDGCEVYKAMSIQILGNAPHWRAQETLKIGMNAARLGNYLVQKINGDPVRHYEFFNDQREFLDPCI